MNIKKIMVVDDNEEMLGLITKRLTLENYAVKKLTKGEEVLPTAKIFRPDLVLMDIVLEDIDGAEAVSRLQRDAQTSKIPVIFLSGIVTGDAENKQTSIKVGGRDYLALGKPFRFEELLEKINIIKKS